MLRRTITISKIHDNVFVNECDAHAAYERQVMKHEKFGEIAGMEPGRTAPRAGVTLICEVRQGSRPWTQARLEDLSPGGFRIARLASPRMDLPLRIRIPGMQLLSAEIRWVRDGAVGCAFAEPLHVAVFEHIVRHAS